MPIEYSLSKEKACRAPNNREIAIGAITEEGNTYLNELVVKGLKISSEYIMKEKLEQMQEIERRVALYCSDKKVITRIDNLDLKDRTVILADDWCG